MQAGTADRLHTQNDSFTTMSDEEFSNDDAFDNISESAWADLDAAIIRITQQQQSTASQPQPQGPQPLQQRDSFVYTEDDFSDFDEAAWNLLDDQTRIGYERLQARNQPVARPSHINQQNIPPVQPTGPSHLPTHHSMPENKPANVARPVVRTNTLPLSQRDLNTDSSTSSLQSGKGKRPRHDSQPPSPRKKGKMKAHNTTEGDKSLNSFLKAYHADLECPICQDFLVAAHVCVPCGHSFCGECLSQWVEVKKDCPSCRGKLNSPRMVPNVALNNLVDTHLEQLARIKSNQEWKRGGSKHAEREARKKVWQEMEIEAAGGQTAPRTSHSNIGQRG
ncbi:hypothetical protein EV421DRAFT_51359 [Armillaria borealis]|uniref:RING-type domain-containing protein n=1 Tax=Armillaria borealis TaxID=47425 RepID=A0AA39N324_9AGAR|nr:hypothetical protein EV421DRAFT_51359 [Armillaria borealis]